MGQREGESLAQAILNGDVSVELRNGKTRIDERQTKLCALELASFELTRHERPCTLFVLVSATRSEHNPTVGCMATAGKPAV